MESPHSKIYISRTALVKNVKAFIFCFLFLPLLMSSVGSAAESNSIQISESPSSPTTPWKLDIYGESYKSITNQIPILFSRWMIHRPSYLSPQGTLKLGFENFTSNLPPSSNPLSQWSFSLGYYYSLHKNISAMTSLRAENINLHPTLRNYPLRVGLLGGTFNFLPQSSSIFTESYYEAYSQSLRTSNTHYELINMGSASVKLGHRWEQSQSPFFIDPLILELRGYSASHPELAGEGYCLLNIGSRIIFYKESPSVYSSLFITQSWRLDRSSTNPSTRPSPWILFTFGGTF